MPNNNIYDALLRATGSAFPPANAMRQYAPQGIDLGKILIQAEQQGQQAPPSSPPIAPQQPAPQAQPQQQPQENKGRSLLMNLLLQAGIPIAGGVVAGINPNILPEMAGLAGGYRTGLEGQEKINREEQGEKDFIVIDPETGEQQTFRVPKQASVQQKRTKDNSLAELLGTMNNQTQQPTTQQQVEKVKQNIPSAPQGKVLIEKDGKSFYVPQGQLQQAIEEGYKQVQ